MPWRTWKHYLTYFDGLAEPYDCLRPEYPQVLFKWLSLKVAPWPPSRVVDVGAGTGFASLPLARLGCPVTAVEQSRDMAGFLRKKARGVNGYEVVHSPFEKLSPQTSGFDLAMCGTAFHWLAPSSRVSRIARMLKGGGWLCLAWNIFEEDETCQAIREALDRCCPSLETERSPAHAPAQNFRDVQVEVSRGGGFRLEGTQEWVRPRTYVRDDLLPLLLTHTGVRALPKSEIDTLRKHLLNTVGTEIEIVYRVTAILFRRMGRFPHSGDEVAENPAGD